MGVREGRRCIPAALDLTYKWEHESSLRPAWRLPDKVSAILRQVRPPGLGWHSPRRSGAASVFVISPFPLCPGARFLFSTSSSNLRPPHGRLRAAPGRCGLSRQQPARPTLPYVTSGPAPARPPPSALRAPPARR